MAPSPDTHFAPAQRKSRDELLDTARNLAQSSLAPWLDAVPLPVLIINEQRQILFSNMAFLALAGCPTREDPVGQRPGEALGCVHSRIMAAGCGCSKFCNYCGAVQAILNCLRGEADCQNCRLLRRDEEGEHVMDLQVFTRPVALGDVTYTMFTAMDISHEKRLKHMERAFYHELIDVAGGMDALTSYLTIDPDNEREDEEFRAALSQSATKILAAALYHRDLNAAEQETLAVHNKVASTRKILDQARHEAALRGQVRLPPIRERVEDRPILTDPRLAAHVLANLLINAAEAALPEDTVELGCRSAEADPNLVVFWVSNPGAMDKAARMQLFKRYVSTKGPDRGLGTYLAKLLADKYLGGSLTCTTASNTVTFTMILPAALDKS
ncbi:MAG: hypothetical protein D6E12_13670 [Desulfovibrio sp.]|nr:MAG: hypothetical protein D6E12_13670 [Desulfovibrio sp.]